MATTIEDKIADHMAAWDKQRGDTERIAEIVAAYYCALITGGVNEQLANMLTIQYQYGLLGMAKQEVQK